MEIAINMEKVELGETKNHLLFMGYVPSLNNFFQYKFDFTGVDLISTSGLTTNQLEKLWKVLIEDYGYPPFDANKLQSILGNGKQYRIKM